MPGGKARSRVLAVLVGALVFTITSPFPGASALTSDEGSLLSYTNAERAKYGKPKLQLASDLVAVARQHSAEMAAKGALYHNSSVASDVDDWRKIGENVGRGPSVKAIHNAFMASSSHRVHILDGAYDRVGVGTAWRGSGSNKTIYVTVVFVDRTGGSSSAWVAPKPPTKSAPAHAPRRRPAATPPLPATRTVGFLLELLALDAAPDEPDVPAPPSSPR